MAASRVRIKICGITSAADALAAVSAGADAVGFVFYPPSPRAVDGSAVRYILRDLPPFVTKVGLFVDADSAAIRSILSTVHLDLLQFHGSETPEQCRALDRPYIKAIRMQPDTKLPEICDAYSDAAAILLDAYVEGVVGGTGRNFDWALIPRQLPKPIILAGGLTPANVADAITQVRPYAVDVSGGVEMAKGVKDPRKMQAFVEGVTHAQCC